MCGVREADEPAQLGRSSGVIVDGCKGHGVWFDHDELEATLSWVRSGGEARVQQGRAEEKRELERGKRLESVVLGKRLEDAGVTSSSSPFLEALNKLVDWFGK